MHDNITQIAPHIKLGSDYDVCTVCADNYVTEHRCPPFEARKALNGKFIGKKLISVNDVVLCEKCTKELYCTIAENGEIIDALGLSYDDMLDMAQQPNAESKKE